MNKELSETQNKLLKLRQKKQEEKIQKALEEFFNQPMIEITYKTVVSKKDAWEFAQKIDKAFMEQGVNFDSKWKEIVKK